MGEIDLVERLRDHNRSFNCVSEQVRDFTELRDSGIRFSAPPRYLRGE